MFYGAAMSIGRKELNVERPTPKAERQLPTSNAQTPNGSG